MAVCCHVNLEIRKTTFGTFPDISYGSNDILRVFQIVTFGAKLILIKNIKLALDLDCIETLDETWYWFMTL